MALPRQVTPRLLLLAALVAGFALAWRQLNQIPLLVVGQPSVTGPLQRDNEAPFFVGLRERTGLPIKVTYKPVDQIGFKDVYQLQSLKDGTFDLVSLRFIQNSRVEPSLAGIDLPGLIADYPTAKRVAAAYAGTVDRYLQQRYASKLLGIWSFGPQEVFCRRPVSRLADLRGMSIRVASPLLATVLEELGAKPAVIPFEDTRASLEAGLVDCAITSAQSAHFAGWLGLRDPLLSDRLSVRPQWLCDLPGEVERVLAPAAAASGPHLRRSRQRFLDHVAPSAGRSEPLPCRRTLRPLEALPPGAGRAFPRRHRPVAGDHASQAVAGLGRRLRPCSSGLQQGVAGEARSLRRGRSAPALMRCPR